MTEEKLARYRKIRDFSKTSEPSGSGKAKPSNALRFVVQKHAASHLHFDLRLEYDGTFHSWAVPKGPSLNPKDRRLAMQVEDHPLDYGDFEGTIPKGEYGGGTVMLWDRGYWAPEAETPDIGAALAKGELKFVLDGKRLKGSWVLVRTRRDQRGRASWLLIKHRDEAAVTETQIGPTDEDRSVASGRRMDEIAAGKGRSATPFMTGTGTAAGAVWSSDAGHQVQPKGSSAPAPSRTKSTVADELPDFIEPQLAKPAEAPPAGDGWAHEIKFDGYRMQLRVEGKKARLRTRKGLDWSARYPEIAAAGRKLPDGIYDGEIVALDETGSPDFAALQAATTEGHTKDLVFFVFDQLFLGLEDMRPRPLSQRKTTLRDTLAGAPENVRYVDHFVTAGDAVLQSACRMKLEGIVSKRLNAPYRSGRLDTWVKSKCRAGHEVVIGGYTTTKGAFRSLIAGVHREGKLVEVGRIGTGFGRRQVERLLPELHARETEASPFSVRSARRNLGEIHWLRPELVAEIEYEGFTADGLLRQAAFKALRDDKPAAEVGTVERAPTKAGSSEPPKPSSQTHHAKVSGSAVVMGVTLSHADKALWPADGDQAPITKRDLACYYEAVGERLMPHIRGRPCSIIRFPNGITGEERFFQRHTGKGQSNLIGSVTVWGDRKPYLQFDRLEALVAAAQVDALELHPWNCEPFKPEQPGRLVFDLDPAPDVAFDEVVLGARELRDRLSQLGLESFAKTTGGKGLHVVTPLLAEGLDWAAAKAFAMNICKKMAADSPDRYLINMSKARRNGRIFLDYLRNDRMATAVAPLSPRGRAGAPVSMPLKWTQIKKGLDPSKYTIRTAPSLLQKSDAWDGYCAAGRPLKEAIKRLDAG